MGEIIIGVLITLVIVMLLLGVLAIGGARMRGTPAARALGAGGDDYELRQQALHMARLLERIEHDQLELSVMWPDPLREEVRSAVDRFYDNHPRRRDA